VNKITVNCVCGTHIGSHWCSVLPGPPQPPRYTLDEIEQALGTALGGDVPRWVWDEVRGVLEAIQT